MNIIHNMPAPFSSGETTTAAIKPYENKLQRFAEVDWSA